MASTSHVARSGSSLALTNLTLLSDELFPSTSVGVAVRSMPTTLATSVKFRDGTVVQIQDNMKEKVVTILKNDLAKITGMLSLIAEADDLEVLPATCNEMLSIIQEEIGLESEGDTENELAEKGFELSTRKEQIEKILRTPDLIPQAIFERYQLEITFRVEVLKAIQLRIEQTVSALQQTPSSERMNLSQLDQLLGELLVMEKACEKFIISPNDQFSSDSKIDLIAGSKRVFGCVLEPLELLGQSTVSEVSPPLVRMVNNQRNPLIERIFRELTVNNTAVTFKDENNPTSISEEGYYAKAMRGLLTDEEMRGVVLLGEKHIAEWLKHYSELSRELQQTDIEERNPLVVDRLVAQGMMISEYSSSIKLTSYEAEIAAISELFSTFAKRIESAKENILQINNQEMPAGLIQKYREAMIKSFSEIVHLQNLRVKQLEEFGTFDLHGASMKGQLSVRLVNQINLGQFALQTLRQ